MLEKGNYSLNEIKNEIKLIDIHKKYNFYIQPIINNENITINGQGSLQMYLINKTLNFSTQEEISFDIIMENPNNTENISLNPNANKNLTCENIGRNVKRCIVTKSHFKSKSGYYNIYHLNHANKFVKFYEYSPIKVIIPIIIKIKDIDETDKVNIGQEGVISLKTEFKDSDDIFDELDIEDLTLIAINFYSENSTYKADCHLWKPKEDNLSLICKFNESLAHQRLKLNDEMITFDYKNYSINIVLKNDLFINQLNSTIAFLYSDKQEININDTSNEYSLVFKKKVFNKESLILYNEDNEMKNIYLDCVEEKKELNCIINKDKLIGILAKGGEKFCLSQLTESEGKLKFESVLDIIINYENVIKKNISLSITKLLTPKVEKNNFIVLETNSTEDIQIISTDYFTITQNSNDNNNLKCLLKKSNNQKEDKLLLLCNIDYPGEYKFDFDEIVLNNINILYSFTIFKTNLTEKAIVSEIEGTKILSIYPEELNFTSQDNLTIIYQTENPDKLKNIKLNKNSSELKCKDKNDYKECIVTKSHFNESGYYYTYYNNSLGDEVISYEIPKIQIIIKENNGGETNPNKKFVSVAIIIGSAVGGLAVIISIVIIIIFVKKKKANSNEMIEKRSKILPNSEEIELIEGNNLENEYNIN